VQLLAVSPDGKTIVTPGDAKDMWIWDIEKERIRDKWSAQFKLVHAVTFSRDGRILIAAGGNGNLPGSQLFPGQVTIWDVRTGKRLQTFKALDVTIGKIALSPDGKLLAVSPSEHLLKVNVWDISHSEPNEDHPKQ
jgi:glucose repression regulatory protein TUP1